jgi:hypothetical protein
MLETVRRPEVADSKFKLFIKEKKDAGELQSFAHGCGTSVLYITGHLLPAKKVPRKDLLRDLVLASDGQLTREDVLEHFYPSEMFSSTRAA